jgi:S-adenosylmethionine:tRNA ribosyltransferase-isomerase
VFYIFAVKIFKSGMKNGINPKNIRIEEYDYPLPDNRIAQFPLEFRDRSKLLVYQNSNISESVFSNLASHLPSGSLVIFNETRVIHARLIFYKDTGAPIEIFCLEPLAPSKEHQQALAQTGECEWLCLVGNSKRWKSGQVILETEYKSNLLTINASRKERFEGGASRIKFSWQPSGLSFAEVLESAGRIPLPPYINRDTVSSDETTYQTVYAKNDGSVAAPTAGLHFTEKVLESLKSKNIDTLRFTLHVGAGTFKPVSSENLSGHEMHAEQVFLPVSDLEALKESPGRPVVAVGTTTTRLLESLYWHGVKVIKGLSAGPVMDVLQWDPYELDTEQEIGREEALEAVIASCKHSSVTYLSGKTSLIIVPGYRFRYPDILVTNFHQPKSTLLLLIAAFIGDDWKKSYIYALDHDFRFLSYGDSCLFFRK